MQQLVPRASVSRFHPVYVMKPHAPGLGDATPAQITAAAGGAAAPVVVAAAAPATAAALGISASLAAPIVGAVFTGILMGVEALLNSGCGQACIVTSQWANQAAALLEQNIKQYFSIPAPRTTLDKMSGLNMFDAIWSGLVQRCSLPGLSTAGQNCIADRQAGACKWKQTGQPEFPGQPNTGECWNWFLAYRDPIANDPVISPTTSVLNSVGSTLSSILPPGLGGSSSLLVVGAGLILLAVVAGGNN